MPSKNMSQSLISLQHKTGFFKNQISVPPLLNLVGSELKCFTIRNIKIN